MTVRVRRAPCPERTVRELFLATSCVLALAVGGCSGRSTSTIPATTARTVSAKACGANCSTPAMADAFVDSIGVNLAVEAATLTDSTLWPLVYPLLEQSGIRHIRAGGPALPQIVYDRINQLYNDVGIRNDSAVDYRSSASEISAMIVSTPHMELIEGQNEYDIVHPASDPAWWTTLTTSQQLLATTVRANPAMQSAGVKIVCPSFTGAATAQTFSTGAGSLSNSCDYGNSHNAFDGYWPGSPGWGASFSASYPGGTCSGAYKTIAYGTCYPRWVSGAAPVIVTEMGNGPVVPDTWPGCGSTYDCRNWTSYSLATKYLPRQLLAWFQNGNPRAYIYRFIDGGPNAGTDYATMFGGMIDGNGSPKPPYFAVKNLIAALRDPGPSFTTTPFPLTLSGSTTNVQWQLFEKRDGSYVYVVWIEASGQDPTTNPPTAIAVQPQSVTVTAGRGVTSATTATIQADGSLSAPAPLGFANGAATLSVTDSLTIVRIVPSK